MEQALKVAILQLQGHCTRTSYNDAVQGQNTMTLCIVQGLCTRTLYKDIVQGHRTRTPYKDIAQGLTNMNDQSQFSGFGLQRQRQKTRPDTGLYKSRKVGRGRV